MPDQHSILENITCGLCTGFLVDAVSLAECLHPFCRSCLLKRLQKSNRCPTCHRDLGRDLSSAFKFDQTLQDLVYKLAPQAYWSELKSRGEFLRKATVTEEERTLIMNKGLLQVSSRLCAPDERLSIVLEFVSTFDAITESTDDSKDTTLQSESVSAKDRPTAATFKRYFRCPATAKIQQLRKILEMKLELGDNFCIYFLDQRLKDALNDDYELRDLAYIFAWDREKPLQLYFTIAKYPVEEEKPPVLDIEEMPELRAESPGMANTSMDPEPVVDPRLPQLGVQLNIAALENGGVHPGPIIRAFTGSEEPPKKKKRRPAAKKTPLSNSALSNASGSSASNSPFNASSPATPVTSHAQKFDMPPQPMLTSPPSTQPVTIIGIVNSSVAALPTSSASVGPADASSPSGAMATNGTEAPTSAGSELSRPSSSMGVTLPTRSEGAPLTPVFSPKTSCEPHPLKLPIISATSQASSMPIAS